MHDREVGETTLAHLAGRALATCLVLFVAVSWMPRVTTIGESDVGVGALLLALMVPLMLFAPRRARIDPNAQVFRAVLLVGVGLLLVWGYIGVYRLEEPFRAGRLFLSVGQGVILILAVTEFLTARTVRIALLVSVGMLTVVAGLSLYNYIGGVPLEITYLQRDRSSGLFKNPNQYGMIVSMVVPFAVALMFQGGRRVLGALLFVVAFASLMMAASKTNLLLALALALVPMSSGMLTRGRVATLLVALPILLVLIAVGGLPVLEWFNPRAAMILESKIAGEQLEQSTLEQRFELWRHSLDVMRHSPWFGEGTGQRIDTIGQEHTHSHNVFLDLGRTVGIPGVAGAVVFIFAACWLVIGTLARVTALPSSLATRLPDRAIVIGASFAVLSYVLSNQMSDSMGPSTSVFFWLCLALVLRRDELLFSASVHPASHRVVTHRKDRATALSPPGTLGLSRY